MTLAPSKESGSHSADTDERLLVISADCHAGPSMESYRPYVEPRFVGLFDEYVEAIHASDAEMGKQISNRSVPDVEFTKLADERNKVGGLSDPEARLRDLEADGIVAEVIFPQGSVPFAPYPALGDPRRRRVDLKPEPAVRAAGARAYNRWLADLCNAHPGRRAGIAVLPIRDIEHCVEEVRWARENGLTGGVSLPPIDDGYPMYNDPAYEPLWAACAEYDMTITVHGGSSSRFYGGRPESISLILAETDFFTRRPLWFMIFSGVFERHPTLRLTITESRAGWVPWVLHELDSIYLSPTTGLKKLLPRKPSEYFASNCYIGASFLSQEESEMRYEIGVDRLMWGSDYPHVEGTWPYTQQSLRMATAPLNDEELAKVLGLNAARCYGFDTSKLVEFAKAVGPTIEELRVPLDEIPSSMNWAFREVGPWA